MSSSESCYHSVLQMFFLKCDNFPSCNGRVCLHLVVTKRVYGFIKNCYNFFVRLSKKVTTKNLP